jgi:polyhydroxyalkanoate synthesis regulator phasin
MDIDAIADTNYPSNIAEFIKKVFENIIKDGLEKIESSETTGDITKECQKKQHEINEKVKDFMRAAISLDKIAKVECNSDYNFTDSSTKTYRYQAVFDIKYYL